MCNERHSVKTFKNQNVDEQQIKEIINLVQTAPSAGNLQAYKIYLIRDKEKINLLASASNNQNFICDSPVLFAFVANQNVSKEKYGQKGEDLFAIQDATIACTFAMLAASSLGLDTAWIGAFDEIQVKQILGLNNDTIPVSILAVGYSDYDPLNSTRKKNSELVQLM